MYRIWKIKLTVRRVRFLIILDKQNILITLSVARCIQLKFETCSEFPLISKITRQTLAELEITMFFCHFYFVMLFAYFFYESKLYYNLKLCPMAQPEADVRYRRKTCFKVIDYTTKHKT